MTDKALGIFGETLVCTHLKEQGYQIIERNFSRRGGEIDIIAQKRSSILFVEVKTRSNDAIDPAYAITQAKQQKIVRTAKEFISGQQREYDYRFDVALVVALANQAPQLTYLENAFQAEE